MEHQVAVLVVLLLAKVAQVAQVLLQVLLFR
jgi:hypothetical protein